MSAPEHHTLIVNGLDDLEEKHPLTEGRVTVHRSFDADGVRLRHLAFDSGVVMKEHSAPEPLIVQVVSGRVRFSVEGADHTLRAGGVLHVPAGVRHEVEAFEPSRLLLTFIG